MLCAFFFIDASFYKKQKDGSTATSLTKRTQNDIDKKIGPNEQALTSCANGSEVRSTIFTREEDGTHASTATN